METRPTTDRIKETLFNMIGNDVYHCRFLDLFAGSGQMGIEALSRGASYACFVEKDKGALACIRQNLAHTDFTNESDVVPGDVLICLRGIEGAEAFDIIFIDPPYQLGVERQVLEAINQYGLLHEDGYIDNVLFHVSFCKRRITTPNPNPLLAQGVISFHRPTER